MRTLYSISNYSKINPENLSKEDLIGCYNILKEHQKFWQNILDETKIKKTSSRFTQAKSKLSEVNSLGKRTKQEIEKRNIHN